MAALNSKADTYLGPFEIDRIREWLRNLRSSYGQPSLELALVFVSPAFSEHSGLLLSLIKDELNPELTAGCTSTSLISNAQEFENVDGFSLGLFHLPNADLKTTCFSQRDIELGTDSTYWTDHNEVDEPNGWIVFADPFHMDLDSWLTQWNHTYPGTPILGGLATGRPGVNQTEIYLNDQVYSQGGVAIAIRGDIQVRNVISQGCTPIGEPWIITKASENILQEIGNRPAYEVLVETVNNLPKDFAPQVQGNLFVGLVTDEYHDDFKRGDFLIRNLLGADPEKGILAIGALPRLGQTVQFQLRSPEAAKEDLSTLLKEKTSSLEGEMILGGLLCTCNGRGQRLFGSPNHDAQSVIEAFGEMGLVGFFCNGELGPVGNQNFLHGYTASIALFTSPRK
jgi:small ligand-binding sensory domain FIST